MLTVTINKFTYLYYNQLFLFTDISIQRKIKNVLSGKNKTKFSIFDEKRERERENC